MRALATALVSAFIAAALVLAGGLFLLYAFRAEQARETARRADLGGALVAASLAREEALEFALLAQLCARDVHVERLALELATGALDRGAAAWFADGIAKRLAKPVFVLRADGRKLELLGESQRAPSLHPSLEALEAARARSVAMSLEGERLWLLRSCTRGAGAHALFLAVATNLDRDALDRLGGHTGELELRLSAPGSGEPHVAQALAFRGESGAPVAELVVTAPEAGESSLLLGLSFVVACAALLGGSVGALYARRKGLHERTLSELERAAERVAQGDLTSSIGLALGARADQTFRTFDRMTKELREMRARLAEAEREAAFREVARRIAHEIKNPLAPIKLAIETLRKVHDKGRTDFPEIFEESTRAILDEVKRLEHIVREFGEFARLPKPEPGELDLGELVKDALPLYVPEDVSLSCEVATELPRVRADREQLTQVLVNLLKNALDAARSSARPALSVRVTRSPQGVAFEVGDSGPGVPADERERVFEPYFTTKSEGTGLGLAIVKRIVSDHGGTIRIGESALGGANVRVELPSGA